MATLALKRLGEVVYRLNFAGSLAEEGGVGTEQIRGCCNATVPRSITAMVYRWLKERSAQANSGLEST